MTLVAADVETVDRYSERTRAAGWPAPGWYAVGLSDSLVPGEVVPVRVGEHDLVAYRTGSGSVHVASGTCPRRGFPLADATIVGEDLVSAVDGWSWGPSGVVKDDQGVDRSDSGLVLDYHAVRDVAGLIVMSVSASDAELGDLAPGDLAPAAVGESDRMEAGPLSVLENLADPLTLSFLLGGVVVESVRVAAAEPTSLHLQCVVGNADDERRVEMVATGPGLVTLEEPGRGRVLFATTPISTTSLVVRTAVWPTSEAEPDDLDWSAVVGRQLQLLEASSAQSASDLEEAERRALAPVWLWSAGREVAS